MSVQTNVNTLQAELVTESLPPQWEDALYGLRLIREDYRNDFYDGSIEKDDVGAEQRSTSLPSLDGSSRQNEGKVEKEYLSQLDFNLHEDREDDFDPDFRLQLGKQQAIFFYLPGVNHVVLTQLVQKINSTEDKARHNSRWSLEDARSKITSRHGQTPHGKTIFPYIGAREKVGSQHEGSSSATTTTPQHGARLNSKKPQAVPANTPHPPMAMQVGTEDMGGAMGGSLALPIFAASTLTEESKSSMAGEGSGQRRDNENEEAIEIYGEYLQSCEKKPLMFLSYGPNKDVHEKSMHIIYPSY